MRNIPKLEMVCVLPLGVPAIVTAGDRCEHCDTPASKWPTGLMSVDREPSGPGRYMLCPTCATTVQFAPEDGLVGMLRRGVIFDYIYWFWFVADTDAKQLSS